MGTQIDSVSNYLKQCLKKPTVWLQIKCLEDLFGTKGKKFDDAIKILQCELIHAAYTKLACKGCTPGMKKEEILINIVCLAEEVALRSSYLGLRCDYCLPGSIARPGSSPQAEKGHQIQRAVKAAALAACEALALTA